MKKIESYLNKRNAASLISDYSTLRNLNLNQLALLEDFVSWQLSEDYADVELFKHDDIKVLRRDIDGAAFNVVDMPSQISIAVLQNGKFGIVKELMKGTVKPVCSFISGKVQKDKPFEESAFDALRCYMHDPEGKHDEVVKNINKAGEFALDPMNLTSKHYFYYLNADSIPGLEFDSSVEWLDKAVLERMLFDSIDSPLASIGMILIFNISKIIGVQQPEQSNEHQADK